LENVMVLMFTFSVEPSWIAAEGACAGGRADLVFDGADQAAASAEGVGCW
jgi:hypothetical protein